MMNTCKQSCRGKYNNLFFVASLHAEVFVHMSAVSVFENHVIDETSFMFLRHAALCTCCAKVI